MNESYSTEVEIITQAEAWLLLGICWAAQLTPHCLSHKGPYHYVSFYSATHCSLLIAQV